MKKEQKKCKDCARCSTVRVGGFAICQYTGFNIWDESLACEHFFDIKDIW